MADPAAAEGKDGEQPRGDAEGGSSGTARPAGSEQQEGGTKRKLEEQEGEPPKKSVSTVRAAENIPPFTWEGDKAK